MKKNYLSTLLLLPILMVIGCVSSGGAVIDGGVERLPVESVVSSSDDGNVAENTLDTFADTRWSAEGETSTITYDFGAVAKVGKIALAFYKSNIRYTLFEVYASRDGKTWETVFEGKNFKDVPDLGWYEIDADVTARYIKIDGHGYEHYDKSKTGLWTSLTEAAFFSSKDAVPGELSMAEAPIEVSYTQPGLINPDGSEHPVHEPNPVTGSTIDVREFKVNLSESKFDDTPAIQAAIDSAEEGDEVFLPAGTYDIYQPLVFKSKVNLRGEEGTVLKVKPVKDNYIQSVFLLLGVHDVVVSDMTLTSAFDGNFTTDHKTNNPERDGPKYMVRITDSSSRVPSYNITVDNLLIEKYQTMGVRIANSHDVVVKNSTFQNATDIGGGGAGYGVSIQGDGNGRNRIGFSNDSRYNLVEECTFQGPYIRHGVLIQYYSHNNLVRNNTLIQTKLDAIDLHGEDEYLNEIAFNRIKDIETGAAIGVGNTGATHDMAGPGNWIHDNHITNVREGIKVHLGSPDTLIENNIITGCEVVNSKGIYLQYAPNTIIRNNRIEDNPALGFWGLLINGDSGTEGRGVGIAENVLVEGNSFRNISGGLKITAGTDINMKDNVYENLDAEILDSRKFDYVTDLIPSQVLNLLNWKITLPIDNAREILQPAFKTYVHPEYFYTTKENDGVVFRAPVQADGTDATTANSKYPRSELREMALGGKIRASWDTDNGRHVMKVVQAITHLPEVKNQVVAGQIHDADDDVVMIRLEGSRLFVEAEGVPVGVLDENYILGTKFEVEIAAEKDEIVVTYNKDVEVKYPVHKEGCYFKAGVYTQSNLSKGDAPDAYGEVIIYDLNVTHSGVEADTEETYENPEIPASAPVATLPPVLDTYIVLMRIDGVIQGNKTPNIDDDKLMIKTSSGQTTIRIMFVKYDLSQFAEKPDVAAINLYPKDSNGTTTLAIYGFEDGVISDYITWSDIFTDDSRLSKNNSEVMDYINHFGTLTGEVTVGSQKPEDPVTEEDHYVANVSSFVSKAESDVVTLAFIDLMGVNVNLQLHSSESDPAYAPTMDLWTADGKSLGVAAPRAAEEKAEVKADEAAAFEAAAAVLNLDVDHVDEALTLLNYGTFRIVDGKVTLPEMIGKDVEIKWESLNPEVVSDEGVIAFPAESTDVTFKATLMKNKEKTEREFFVVIPASQ
ncbi:MAG: polysaccharide lyase family 7 protein [Spirochaetales bacterium]|nr:polysaccharide lyase family 7 protein [Spirochaetales bacterium]